MMRKFAERLRKRAVNKIIAFLSRLTDAEILRIVIAINEVVRQRRCMRVIDEYLADPEEAGEAGAEIKRNAELLREQERCQEFADRYNSVEGRAPIVASRIVPPEEVMATIAADERPGRLSKENPPGCGSTDGPLMQPGEFYKRKLMSWEESRRRPEVAPPSSARPLSQIVEDKLPPDDD